MPPLRNVTSLAFTASQLYIGGVFSAVGGHPRYNLAALDPRTGALLPWKRANGGDVDTILVTLGDVIIAGHDGFGATDTRSGRPLAWTSRLGGVASAFAADAPLVYPRRRSPQQLPLDRRAPAQEPGRDQPRDRTLHDLVAESRAQRDGRNDCAIGDEVLVLGTFTKTIG